MRLQWGGRKELSHQLQDYRIHARLHWGRQNYTEVYMEEFRQILYTKISPQQTSGNMRFLRTRLIYHQLLFEDFSSLNARNQLLLETHANQRNMILHHGRFWLYYQVKMGTKGKDQCSKSDYWNEVTKGRINEGSNLLNMYEILSKKGRFAQHPDLNIRSWFLFQNTHGKYIGQFTIAWTTFWLLTYLIALHMHCDPNRLCPNWKIWRDIIYIKSI